MKSPSNLHFQTKLPEEFKDAFYAQLHMRNLKRISIFCWAVGIMYSLLLLVDYLRIQSGQYEQDVIYKYLLSLHLSGICFYFFIFFIKVKEKDFYAGKYNPKRFSYLIIVFFALTSVPQDILPFKTQGEIFSYIALILLINWALNLTHPARIIFNLTSLISVSLAIIVVGRPSPILFLLSIYEVVGFTVVAFIFGTIDFNFRASKFLDEKLLEIEKKKIEELERLKSSLYTNITHEFRTPLTVILGMADQIKEQVNEPAKEGLRMIRRNGRQLLGLVNQLLDLRKLESGSMPVKMVQGDILLYIQYILESFHSYAESKNIRLHFITDLKELHMDYDPEKLLAILSNLLSNAIKFTLEGGDIYLSVASRQSSVIRGREPSPITHLSSSISHHPSIIIRLRDTGVGIAEEKLPYIFDRFYQVDDESTRKAEGTGIGLALTKELVKLLGGQISVESEPGKGTEFKILLPLSRKAEPIEVMEPLYTAEVTEAIMPVTGMTLAGQSDQALILIIEDNRDVRSYLQSCLSGDYRLMMAEDGRIGIEEALAEIPDLIVSDVMMPHKDGFEVCETLKNDERASHIPIILLTARADVESRLSGLKRGADAYLAKPFHKEELLIRIEALLEQRRKLQTYYLSQALANRAPTATEETSEEAAVENAFVLKIREIVEAHLDDSSFSVEQLCREAALSKAQLFRKLKALLGKSAGELIRSIRLAKAKELLQNPELSITAVAYDTGFNDPLYFSKVFRKEFGMTPTAFREGL